jgi:hypothetical protein
MHCIGIMRKVIFDTADGYVSQTVDFDTEASRS